MIESEYIKWMINFEQSVKEDFYLLNFVAMEQPYFLFHKIIRNKYWDRIQKQYDADQLQIPDELCVIKSLQELYQFYVFDFTKLKKHYILIEKNYLQQIYTQQYSIQKEHYIEHQRKQNVSHYS